MGLHNAHSYDPLWQAHLADLRRQKKQKALYAAKLALSGPLGDTSATDVIATAATIITSLPQYLDTISNILTDPDLPGLVQRIDTLRSYEPPSPSTGQPVGIGLHQFLAPFDAYLYTKKYPIVPFIVGAGVLLFIGSIGYTLGRRRA